MRRAARILLMAGFAAGATLGQSQWSGTSPIYYNGGSVGIGTASPVSALHVLGADYKPLTIQSPDGALAAMRIWNSSNGNGSGTVWRLGVSGSGGYSGTAANVFSISDDAGAVKVSIQSAGNVGIGTAAPNAAYKLDVAGAIGATDIYVTSNALPDYVFDADYRNAPLSEVAAYIEQNHHLPGIPSAADAEKNRLSVADMQSKLLQKVEELTLHMIAAEKRNGELEAQNAGLQARIAQLEAKTAGTETRKDIAK